LAAHKPALYNFAFMRVESFFECSGLKAIFTNKSSSRGVLETKEARRLFSDANALWCLGHPDRRVYRPTAQIGQPPNQKKVTSIWRGHRPKFKYLIYTTENRKYITDIKYKPRYLSIFSIILIQKTYISVNILVSTLIYPAF